MTTNDSANAHLLHKYKSASFPSEPWPAAGDGDVLDATGEGPVGGWTADWISGAVGANGDHALTPAGITPADLDRSFVIRDETRRAVLRKDAIEAFRASGHDQLAAQADKMTKCSASINLRCTKSENGYVSARIVDVWRCRQSMCPTCLGSDARERGAVFHDEIGRQIKADPTLTVRLYTLTTPRCQPADAEDRLKAVKDAYRRFRSLQEPRSVGHLGLTELHVGRASSDDDVSAHVHIHAVALMKATAAKAFTSARISDAWSKAMNSAVPLVAKVEAPPAAHGSARAAGRWVAYASKGPYVMGTDHYDGIDADDLNNKALCCPLSDREVLLRYYVLRAGERLMVTSGSLYGFERKKELPTKPGDLVLTKFDNQKSGFLYKSAPPGA